MFSDFLTKQRKLNFCIKVQISAGRILVLSSMLASDFPCILAQSGSNPRHWRMSEVRVVLMSLDIERTIITNGRDLKSFE